MGPAITVDDELEEREDIDGGEELSVERAKDGLAGLGVDSKLEGYICDGSLLGVGGGEKTCIPLSGEATIGRVLVLR